MLRLLLPSLVAVSLVGWWCSSVLAQFDLVINVPPTVFGPERVTPEANTQLNLFAGGELDSVLVGSGDGGRNNVELVLHGGTVWNGVVVEAGGHVDVRDGQIRRDVTVEEGGRLSIRGGELPALVVREHATVDLRGGTLSGVHFVGSHTFAGGLVTGTLSVARNSSATILGGEISRFSSLDGSTSTTIRGGKVGGTLAGIVDISGGEVERVHARRLTLRGGSVQEIVVPRDGRATITGGNHGSATIREAVTFQGGVFNDTVLIDGVSSSINGGNFDKIVLNDGARLVLRGGTFGNDFNTRLRRDSGLTIIGNDFHVNGEPYRSPADLQLPTSSGGRLTGALADGTPFFFRLGGLRPGEEQINPQRVTLISTPLPAFSAETLLASRDAIPYGIRDGKTVIADGASHIPNNFTVGVGGSLVVHEEARVGDNLEVIGGRLRVEGRIDQRVNAVLGAEITVDGGSFFPTPGTFTNSSITVLAGETGFLRGDGLRFDISGGTVDGIQDTFQGRQLRISGGEIGSVTWRGHPFEIEGGNIEHLHVHSGGTLNAQVRDLRVNQGEVRISGGRFGDRLTVEAAGRATLLGGEFQLNGKPIADLNQVGQTRELVFAAGDLLSGTFQDGTPFLLGDTSVPGEASTLVGDRIHLQLTPIPEVPVTDLVASVDRPVGLRRGQLLRVDKAANLGHDFVAVGSTIQVEGGGIIGQNLEMLDADLELLGGKIGDHLGLFGSRAVLRSGQVEGVSTVHGGSWSNENADVGPVFAEQANVHLQGGTNGQVSLRGGTLRVAGGSVEAIHVRASETVITAGRIAGEVRLSGGNAQIGGGEIGQIVVTDAGNLELHGGRSGALRVPSGGANVRATGGSFPRHVRTVAESNVTLVGNHFRRNGQPLTSQPIGNTTPLDLDPTDVLSGELRDGTPFVVTGRTIRSGNDGTSAETLPFAPGVLMLESAAVPTSPERDLRSSVDEIPLGIRARETLHVDTTIPDGFRAGWGSAVLVDQDGRIGANSSAIGATISLQGGSLGPNFHAYEASQVSVVRGNIEKGLNVFPHAQLTMTSGNAEEIYVWDAGVAELAGGHVNKLVALHDAQVEVAGAQVDYLELHGALSVASGNVDVLTLQVAAHLDLRAGTVGWLSTAHPVSVHQAGGFIGSLALRSPDAKTTLSGGRLGSTAINGELKILGGDFQLDGVPIANLQDVGASTTAALGNGILTGVYADGSPFLLSRQYGDGIPQAIRLERTALPPTSPRQLVAPEDPIPTALGAGQALTVNDGATLPRHYVVGPGARLTLEPGFAGAENLRTFGATVDVFGGSLSGPQIGVESTLRFAGDSLGTFQPNGGATVHRDGTLRILEGSFVQLTTEPGSTLSISGGEMQGRTVLSGDITISGGFFRNWPFVAGDVTLKGGRLVRGLFFTEPSSLVIEGTQFFVGGEELKDVEPGEKVAIGRGSVSGTLADGSTFRIHAQRYLESIEVRLTPWIGDFDEDGNWTSHDVDSLCSALASGATDLVFDLNDDEHVDRFDMRRLLELAEALPGDTNLDGQVNFADFLKLAASFDQPGTWSQGDVTCDGSVGFPDFLLFAQHFGSGEATATVPEPAGVMAILLCLLAIRHGKRPSKPASVQLFIQRPIALRSSGSKTSA